ncbi:MAG: OmpA family protein [Candidatus Andeanibacterium colombiense]|uniref:OmpA family protein n=1 Tax=Candidatus Andeanibacterium colombiense TaxID=3121345 RepID=A0AAJ6BP60_9SPHN|nr:MAG: OmpA family protein [Sphingomonadaceae bacterium]
MARLLVLFAAISLAGCQTAPGPTGDGFSRHQAAALEARGFTRVGRNYELGLNNRVLFYVDKSDLLPGTDKMLEELTVALVDIGIGGVSVEGHADSTGSNEYNRVLSGKRAESVKAQMVHSGMPDGRVRVVALGEADPVARNDTEEGRAQNRRVVIVVAPEDAAPD